jgi:acyl-CoA synthetase (AMP-forming)/AMP-acid ligase II
MEAYLAAAHLGTVLVPLNTRLSPNELRAILVDCEPSAILIGQPFEAAWRAIQSDVPRVPVVHLTDNLSSDELTYERLLLSSTRAVPPAVRGDDDLLYLYYTSGTTGHPKGVMLSESNIAFATRATQECLELTSRDRVLRSLPAFHAAAVSIWSIVEAGACQVMLPQFDGRAYLEALQNERISVASGVPTMWNTVVHVPDVSSFDLRALRLATYGASPMPEELLRTMARTLPVKLLQMYGMTEVPPLVTVLRPQDHVLDDNGRAHLRSAGQAATGIDVRVVDDQDRDTSPGTVGEVSVRGPNVMVGYWKQPDTTATALRDGWLYTGDLGMLDEDGFLYIVDRKKDMIITGGENVYSTEVESVLYEHPAVLEAAVIGVPDPVWVETVKAVVVLKPGILESAETLQAFCRQRIANYKVPRWIEFVASLPKTATGKISKKDLRTHQASRGTPVSTSRSGSN